VRRTLLVVIAPILLVGAWYLPRSAGEAATPMDQTAAAAPAFDSAKAFEHLRQMVAIGPRPAGSPAIKQTRAYITKQIESYGLKVEEQPFTGATPKGPIDMVNLIVRIPGKRPDKILITGHYDTKLFPNATFVGASDGASSGAFLVEMARVLKAQPQREFTYELVWFDGEEAVIEWDKDKDSTYGSRHYVAAAQKAGVIKTLKAMILIDMIGDRDLQIRRDSHSTPWLNDIVWDAAKRAGHAANFPDLGTSVEDDHLAFVDAGVPSIDIIDLDYPQWHTPQDDLSHVSARSLQIVGDVVLAALPEIEKKLR
jgi:Zn-dependent M28 family amino/carboxypeptidase